MSEIVVGGPAALGLALGAQTTVMLPVFLLGSLSPLIMADVGIDAFGLGMGVGLFYAAAALGSALLAPLADRADAWKVTRYCLLAVAIAGLAIATLGSAAWIIFAGLLVSGLTNGVIQPATNVVVSRFVPAARQGLAFGIKQSSIPLATMLGGFAVPVIGVSLGWKWAYAIAALTALLVAALLPKRREGTRSSSSTKGRLLPWHMLILLAVMSGLGAASANSMAAFLAPSMVAGGHSAEIAGIVLALGSAVSISVRLGMGYAADRGAVPLLPSVAILFAGGAFAYVLLTLSTALPVFIVGSLLAFGMGWGWSGISVLAIVRANLGAAGSATGVTQVGVFSGAVLGPMSFGWLAVNAGYPAAWAMMGIMTFAAACCAVGSEYLVSRHLAAGAAQ
ncbi:MFS transporter [Pelagibacterium flavum]|uniref:MFS transporter n=1 Tax=Pelagibacterium flavum TaxID=2984530 RepID=A0ABY6IR62_9HYPH|nr:MFS transporter [Pelagibacterium sp. YIM 151497]UYQ73101.1 MFS transporter [Pelagibacterium sp. YIM 151497]